MNLRRCPQGTFIASILRKLEEAVNPCTGGATWDDAPGRYHNTYYFHIRHVQTLNQAMLIDILAALPRHIIWEAILCPQSCG